MERKQYHNFRGGRAKNLKIGYYAQNMAGGTPKSYWRMYKKCFPEGGPHTIRDVKVTKYHKSPKLGPKQKRHVPHHFHPGKNHTSKLQRKNTKLHYKSHQKIKVSSGIPEVPQQKQNKYEVFSVVEASSQGPSKDGISAIEFKKNQESSSISSSFVDQDAIKNSNETSTIYSEDDEGQAKMPKDDCCESSKIYSEDDEGQAKMLKDDCCGGGGCGSGCGVCPGINRPPSCGFYTFLKEFIKANCKLSRCEAIKNAKCVYAQMPECTRKLWRRRGCCKRREVCKRRKCPGPCGDEFILEDEEPEDILSELGRAVDNDEVSSNTFVPDPAEFGLSEEKNTFVSDQADFGLYEEGNTFFPDPADFGLSEEEELAAQTK